MSKSVRLYAVRDKDSHFLQKVSFEPGLMAVYESRREAKAAIPSDEKDRLEVVEIEVRLTAEQRRGILPTRTYSD